MKMDVSSGLTKAPSGVYLMPVIAGDGKGDRVFLLIHADGKNEDCETLREECSTIMKHVVLEGEGSAYERLEGALKELNGLLKGFLINGAVKDVHLVAGVLEPDGSLHLSHVGRAEAYLIRDGSASQITEYNRGKPPMSFLHIVSGQLEERDHVVISTQRLLRTITPAQLSQLIVRGTDAIASITHELESEKEVACVLHIMVPGSKPQPQTAAEVKGGTLSQRMKTRGSQRERNTDLKTSAVRMLTKLGLRDKAEAALKKARATSGGLIERFQADLADPSRKRKAHLLLLASAAGVFLIVWMGVQLTLSSQKSQTRGDLAALVSAINSDLAIAENRRLTGETDSANAILKRAEDRAKQVISNENGSFRSEALQLLERIRSKEEELNNVVRIVPKTMANLSAKKSDVVAQGFMNVSEGEFTVYDRQNYYRVFENSVDGPTSLNTEELILDGAYFPRYQSRVFLTTRNSVLEVINGQPTTMKTEDTKGWMSGTDIKTYLRYLYMMSPEKNQIYKYERLADRYGPPAEYNVSGNLKGMLDMTITGPVYVLREADVAAGSGSKQQGNREVVKLLRGENQTFTIRNLPQGALAGVTKIFKSSAKGNFYFLNPDQKRVIITSNDGDLGDSLYLKQIVLDSDQIGKLQDLYVDAEDMRLYLLDEKHVYIVELQNR